MSLDQEQLIAVLRDPSSPSTRVFRTGGGRAADAQELLFASRSRIGEEITEKELDNAVRSIGGRRTTEISLDNLLKRGIRRLIGRENAPGKDIYELPAHIFDGLDLPLHVPAER